MFLSALIWTIGLIILKRREKTTPALRPAMRRLMVLALLINAALIFLIFVFPLTGLEQTFPIDDSYITLTAARNLAQHNQLAINPDAPLAGITSPLHVLLVGGLGKLLVLETADRLVGFLFFLMLVLGVYIWAGQLGADPITAATAGALTMLSGHMAFDALNGLETVMFAALLLWSLIFYEMAAKKPHHLYAMGVIVGLAILTRPEGWFLAAALYSVGLLKNIRSFKALMRLAFSGLAALAVVSPYLLANYHYLDAFFPITVSAKKYFFMEMCRSWGLRMRVLWEAMPPLAGSLAFMLPLLLWPGVFLRRGYPLLLLALFYTAYLLEFPGALLHYWGRYQHPLLPMIMVGLVLGAEGCASLVRRRHLQAGNWIAVLFLVLLLGLGGFDGAVRRDTYRHSLKQIQSTLIEAATWVRNHSAPGDLIAAHDIGALYYFGERKVLDLVGLTDPEVASINELQLDECRSLIPRSRQLYSLLEDRQPKIVIIFPAWDKYFLRITREDNGRHLKKVHSIVFDPRHRYDFYLAHWETEEAPAAEPPPEETDSVKMFQMFRQMDIK